MHLPSCPGVRSGGGRLRNRKTSFLPFGQEYLTCTRGPGYSVRWWDAGHSVWERSDRLERPGVKNSWIYLTPSICRWPWKVWHVNMFGRSRTVTCIARREVGAQRPRTVERLLHSWAGAWRPIAFTSGRTNKRGPRLDWLVLVLWRCNYAGRRPLGRVLDGARAGNGARIGGEGVEFRWAGLLWSAGSIRIHRHLTDIGQSRHTRFLDVTWRGNIRGRNPWCQVRPWITNLPRRGWFPLATIGIAGKSGLRGFRNRGIRACRFIHGRNRGLVMLGRCNGAVDDGYAARWHSTRPDAPHAMVGERSS